MTGGAAVQAATITHGMTPGRSRRANPPAARADGARLGAGKVPEITLGFWVIKIAATTLGETGGDALSMTLHLGYALSSVLLLGILAVLVGAQVAARSFHAFLYWAVIVATTTCGTTIADFADRSLGVGYAGGSALLLLLLLLSLAAWRLVVGEVSASRIATPRVELFYWTTILFSQTLGTALGDYAADGAQLGYGGGALLFGAALAAVVALYVATSLSRVLLFWLAFVLTRPLGATLGDLLDKPVAHGGLALSRLTASALLAGFIVLLLLLIPQRPGGHPGERAGGRSGA